MKKRVKIQISIDDRLMKRIDSYCDENYMKRSTLFTIAICEFYKPFFMQQLIIKGSKIAQKIANQGFANDEDKKMLSKILSDIKKLM